LDIISLVDRSPYRSVWCGCHVFHHARPHRACTAHAGKAQHAFHKGAVGAVAAYKDGNLVATGSSDMQIIMTNIKTGRVITTMLGHSDSVETVAFSNSEYSPPPPFPNTYTQKNCLIPALAQYPKLSPHQCCLFHHDDRI